MEDNQSAPLLGKDIPWSAIEGKLCKVVHFSPLAKVENDRVVAAVGGTPYAFLRVECVGLGNDIQWWVRHRRDFLHVWKAFQIRNEKRGDEVIVGLRSKWHSFLGLLLPQMNIMLCPKDSYVKLTHQKPMASGEAGFLETKPIAMWGEGHE